MTIRIGWLSRAGACALLLACAAGAATARPMDTSAGEWPVYGGDPGAQKYSPLDQINAQTIADLEIAWVWSSADEAPLAAERAKGEQAFTDHFKGTPLMVGGVLYIRTPLGLVEALEAGTGKTLWRFDREGYRGGVPGSYGFTTRGLAYWEDAEGKGRLIVTQPDRKLIALDAATGTLVPEFGAGGIVDLDPSFRRLGEDPKWINYSNQVPVIVGDVVALGHVVTDAELAYLPKGDKTGRPIIPTGDVRGFDVRTGKHLWTFHTVPAEGEFGTETWEDESWKWVGSTNVWSLMSADPELGLIYVPVTAPTFNYYGGFRKGDNLFGQSLVALDAKTGKRAWHFQTIRHPIFDYDMAAAPVVADITVDGRKIKAVVGMNKTGFLYVLDRATGEPVWPIEDRPVPQSTVPGEKTAATQPHPTKPPPVSIQGISEDTVLSLTPAIKAAVMEMISPHDYGPLFTPPSLRGTVLSPGISGGPNWPGGAFDPETGMFYVTAVNNPMIRGLVKSDNYYGYIMRRFASTYQNMPIVNPPWSTLTAVDLNRGEHAWQIANGPGPKDHPQLKPLGLPFLGTPSKSNALVTKSLVFAATTGQQVFGPAPRREDMRISPSIPRDVVEALKLDSQATFWAYDKASGEIVWSHPIGPSFNDGGAPMTYMWEGRQYIVTPVGGARDPAFLIAFALPR